MKMIIVVITIIVIGVVVLLLSSKIDTYLTMGDPSVANNMMCEYSAQCLRGPEGMHCMTSSGYEGVCVLNDKCCPSFMEQPSTEVRSCPFPDIKYDCGRWCTCIGNNSDECVEMCESYFHPYTEIF